MVNKYLLSIIVPVWNQEILLDRALRSIPVRDDIEVIIVNDASTDRTLKTAEAYQRMHRDNVRIITNPVNIGLGLTKNVGYDNARGEYIHQLDSDDYLITNQYLRAIKQIDGSDMIYLALRTNSCAVWDVTEDNKMYLCGGTLRFIKRSFLGDHRCPDVRAEEDLALNNELQQIPHTEKYTHIVCYHYNFPRKGSLCDLKNRGLI